MGRYEDIINEPRHVSSKHPPMPSSARAAQFAPFAALTGFEEEIDEAGRLTDERPLLSDDDVNRLNEIISGLSLRLSEEPEVEISYFIPDEVKKGGAVITVSGKLRLIDQTGRCLILTDGRKIPSVTVTDIKTVNG